MGESGRNYERRDGASDGEIYEDERKKAQEETTRRATIREPEITTTSSCHPLTNATNRGAGNTPGGYGTVVEVT
jgi:hypothetical protein